MARASTQSDDSHRPVRRAVIGKQVRVPKSGELVARSLRLQIVRDELSEGDTLPSETELMEQFGVSRPTLREAFRILESEQLITVRRGARGGGVVHAPSVDVAARSAALVLEYEDTTVRDVYQARAVIEVSCVRTLAVRRTVRQLDQLRAAADAQEERREPEGLHHAIEFHRLLVELAGNKTLRLFSGMLQHILELATAEYMGEGDAQNAKLIARSRKAHAELVDCIAEKDPDGAERVWSKHLAATQGERVKGATGETVLDLLG